MDNALDALKIAFAVLVFVIALSISMKVFGQAKLVSDEVFYMTDKTNFYEYTSGDNSPDGRIVSGETIIPTLYRYYKENFNVIIKDERGNELKAAGADYVQTYRSLLPQEIGHVRVINLDELVSNKYIDPLKDERGNILWEFNLEQEIKKYSKNYRNAPWVGNANIDTKLRVDVEVSGISQKINGVEYGSQTNGGIYNYVNGKKFKETFKEIRYSGKEITIDDDGEIAYVGEGKGEISNPINETLELVKGNTKIEITYQLVN